MIEGDRRTSIALICLVVIWPLALSSLGLYVDGVAPIALPVVACAVALTALIEAARQVSVAVADRSWSRPTGAREVSRLAIGSSVAVVLAFALMPVLGFFGAFGFGETTAQVESTRTSYLYRIDYGDLRPRLRLIVVVACAESTIAVIVAALRV